MDNLSRKLSLVKPFPGDAAATAVEGKVFIGGTGSSSQQPQITHGTAKLTVIEARREINSLCVEAHRRALAWCLYIHADAPKMIVEDIFEWLDEIGARSPKAGKTWNDYHRYWKAPAQKMVSDQRRLLRENRVPCNH